MDYQPALDDSTVAMVATQLSRPVKAGAVQVRPTTAAEWLNRFEQVYREADGSVDRIPWAQQAATPMLVEWLDREARTILRPGARVCVAGCGLGHDVAALNDRGYDAIGIDASSTAIAAAERLHPEHRGAFRVADLMNLPTALHHRFDAVVDVHTLQSMPDEYRPGMVSGLAEMLKRHGVVVSITRGAPPTRDLCTPTAPSFDLLPEQLARLMTQAGLSQTGPTTTSIDALGVRRSRCVFGFSGASPAHGA